MSKFQFLFTASDQRSQYANIQLACDDVISSASGRAATVVYRHGVPLVGTQLLADVPLQEPPGRCDHGVPLWAHQVA